MAPYIFLAAAGLTGAALPQRPRYRYGFLLTTGVLCWLLASLRYVTGFDYRFYETIFQAISSAGLNVPAELQDIEPGFLMLNLLAASLGFGYRGFLFLFHFLFTVLVFAWIGRYSPAPWLSVYLFVTLQYYALSMNFLRQALAAAVILWIYPFLKSRRLLPCCGIILLSACFHRTALIMLPLCFLLRLRISRRHYGLAALAAAGAYFLMDPLLQIAVTLFPKYQHYFTEKYWQGNSFLYVLLPLGCLLFVLPSLRREVHSPSDSSILVNSVFYMFLLQVFITRHFILERLSIYTAFFCLLALPEAALCFDGRNLSKVRTGLLIAGGLLYLFFAASHGFHGVYPYHGVWSRALTP